MPRAGARRHPHPFATRESTRRDHPSRDAWWPRPAHPPTDASATRIRAADTANLATVAHPRRETAAPNPRCWAHPRGWRIRARVRDNLGRHTPRRLGDAGRTRTSGESQGAPRETRWRRVHPTRDLGAAETRRARSRGRPSAPREGTTGSRRPSPGDASPSRGTVSPLPRRAARRAHPRGRAARGRHLLSDPSSVSASGPPSERPDEVLQRVSSRPTRGRWL